MVILTKCETSLIARYLIQAYVSQISQTYLVITYNYNYPRNNLSIIIYYDNRP